MLAFHVKTFLLCLEFLQLATKYYQKIIPTTWHHQHHCPWVTWQPTKQDTTNTSNSSICWKNPPLFSNTTMAKLHSNKILSLTAQARKILAINLMLSHISSADNDTDDDSIYKKHFAPYYIMSSSSKLPHLIMSTF